MHLCDSLVQFKMIMWLKEFIVSTQSVVLHRWERPTHKKSFIHWVYKIKSPPRRTLKADVWSRAHKGISAHVSGACPPLQERTNIRNRSAPSRPVTPGGGGEGVLPYITYTGMCGPTGSWFWSSWFRAGYPYQRRFLERGIIFRTHASSSTLGDYEASIYLMYKSNK